MNCETCPLIQGCDNRIAELEQEQSSVIEGIAASAQFTADLQVDVVSTLIEATLAHADEAINRKAKEGMDKIVSLLADNPTLAKKYFSYLDIVGKQIDREQGFKEILPSKCEGPRQHKRYIVFGETVLKCSSKAWQARVIKNR